MMKKNPVLFISLSIFIIISLSIFISLIFFFLLGRALKIIPIDGDLKLLLFMVSGLTSYVAWRHPSLFNFRSQSNGKTSFRQGAIAYFLYGLAGVIPLRLADEMGKSFQGSHLVPLLVSTLLLCLITVFVGYIIGQFWLRFNQFIRNRRSKGIFEDVKNSIPRQYSIYLRAFSSTGMMPVLAGGGIDSFINKDPDPFMDLEALLAESCEKIAPLVALGEPDNHVGAGRILSTEESWRKDIEILARGAKMIFVLPAGSDGTLWEIEWVTKNNFINKSIFIMPGGFASKHKKDTEGYDWQEHWNELRKEVQTIGIELPRHTHNGLLFSIDEGKMRDSESLFEIINIKSKMKKAIERIVVDWTLTSKQSPSAETIEGVDKNLSTIKEKIQIVDI